MPSNAPVPVTPDPSAVELAEQMLDNHDTQKEILRETLTAAENGQIKEAGRTVCGGGAKIIGPLARYPTSISLASCPVGAGGAWHTHVSPRELTSPRNSIPDMANVVFGYLDASVVTGTDSAEAFVASADRDAMIDQFQNALGLEANSPKKVYEALDGGRVADIRAARKRVRDTFSDHILRDSTGYPEISKRADEVRGGMVASSPEEYGQMEAARAHHPSALGDGVSEKMRSCSADMRQISLPADVDIGGVVVSTAIGTVVGRFVESIVFED